MPVCPQCSKNLLTLSPRCPSCQADLTLLLDYVSHLQGGLERADNLTRAGELGQAVWAYLEVLEVDPDNSQARRQVAQVATAVRQFDRTAPGRRWLGGMRWGFHGISSDALLLGMYVLFAVVLMAGAFFVGYVIGDGSASEEPGPDKSPPALENRENNRLQ